MTLPPETAERLTHLSSALDQRVIRVRFESQASLLDGFALAQRESWIEDCEVIPESLELVIRMAGGFRIQPGQRPAPRRFELDAPSIAGHA
jgi:hypothetical protein